MDTGTNTHQSGRSMYLFMYVLTGVVLFLDGVEQQRFEEVLSEEVLQGGSKRCRRRVVRFDGRAVRLADTTERCAKLQYTAVVLENSWPMIIYR